MVKKAKVESKAASENKGAATRGRDRSPAYPFISLKTAIERVAAFDKYFGRHAGPADKAGLAWGMKEKSSQAYQTLAALKYFGLIEYTGTGKDRAASLSSEARNYLRAQQEGIRREILKRCALKPRQISAYWTKWGADRPPDPICLDELVLKAAYTQSAAETFLAVYDETVAYSGLANSDKAGDTDDDTGEIHDADENPGELKPPPPLKGHEQTKMQPDQGKQPDVKPLASRQDVYNFADGGHVILQWPEGMSKESYAEFEDWIELQLRKIARASGVVPKAKK